MMRTAFKDWTIVIDALGRGDQILILRKGGLIEGSDGFAVEHDRFLLFPTRYHQQRDKVLPEAQLRYDTLAASFPDSSVVCIEFWAAVTHWRRILSIDAARRLQHLHLWRPEVIEQRFEWGRSQDIFLLALRVHRLAQAVELPVLPAYGGCTSWIELATDIDADASRPVLDDAAYQTRLDSIFQALGEPIPAHSL